MSNGKDCERWITDKDGTQYFVFADGLLSNGYMTPFVVDNVQYSCMNMYLRSNPDVMTGMIAKFCQHELSKQCLLSTGERIIVYANKRDRVLGSGLNIDNINNGCFRHWRGQNKLGEHLMDIRDYVL
jgi:hypothetical protein